MSQSASHPISHARLDPHSDDDHDGLPPPPTRRRIYSPATVGDVADARWPAMPPPPSAVVAEGFATIPTASWSGGKVPELPGHEPRMASPLALRSATATPMSSVMSAARESRLSDIPCAQSVDNVVWPTPPVSSSSSSASPASSSVTSASSMASTVAASALYDSQSCESSLDSTGPTRRAAVAAALQQYAVAQDRETDLELHRPLASATR